MWLLFLFLLLSSLFLSFVPFLLLARHRIRNKAIEIKVQVRYKDLPRKTREWVVFLAIGAKVDICTMMMMMIMIRISVSQKGKEPRKKQRDTDISRLPYLPYFYLTIVTSPVLCLVCIVHTYQESQNKVDKGAEIVYSRISSGNYFTCMYQSAVKDL